MIDRARSTNPHPFRVRHKLSQGEFADLLKLDISTVARWEQKGAYPRWLAASLAALKARAATPRARG